MEEPAAGYVQSEPLTDSRLDDTHIRSWRDKRLYARARPVAAPATDGTQARCTGVLSAPNTKASERYTDFSSDQGFVFPSRSTAFNQITLHPALLQAVADLLDVSVLELRLTQSDLWPKYGGSRSSNANDNTDQRMHCDYPNHSLVHPPEWDNPEAVEMIIYLNSNDECAGATAVVPRRGPNDPAYPWPITQTPGVGDLDYVNDRLQAEVYMAANDPEAAAFRAEHLYPREAVANYRFGSVLLYRHDTWHRGRPVNPAHCA